MFFLLIPLLIIVVVVWILLINKIHIDIPSFTKPTLPLARGIFGVYCFTGKQGTGKTYALNKYIRKHGVKDKVYSNVTLLDYEYTKLETIDQLLDLVKEWDCFIVYDEIFSFLSKESRLDRRTKKKLTKFLTQMRKHHNIFLTTAQEWLELPIDFRRYVRVQIECQTRPLGKFGGILKETYFDATNIKWDNLENEYISPLISTKVCKYEKKYMLSYDTEEIIDSLSE